MVKRCMESELMDVGESIAKRRFVSTMLRYPLDSTRLLNDSSNSQRPVYPPPLASGLAKELQCAGYRNVLVVCSQSDSVGYLAVAESLLSGTDLNCRFCSSPFEVADLISTLPMEQCVSNPFGSPQVNVQCKTALLMNIEQVMYLMNERKLDAFAHLCMQRGVLVLCVYRRRAELVNRRLLCEQAGLLMSQYTNFSAYIRSLQDFRNVTMRISASQSRSAYLELPYSLDLSA
uniref:Uncharacterized protein n=1 Tax=Timspurckia oligopyrenoides TaxID=708627 RepID=A0A7S0ZCM9_9RHOD|mmetsp:Transcript_12663/g.22799  ORF Transcript_12663/g.22799 Transcript_12663/m.22799 type:complete len:232 (+) Transcript_12663:213-908(+)